MAYDGKSFAPSVRIILRHREISFKTYKFYRKRYPKISLRDLLDLTEARGRG